MLLLTVVTGWHMHACRLGVAGVASVSALLTSTVEAQSDLRLYSGLVWRWVAADVTLSVSQPVFAPQQTQLLTVAQQLRLLWSFAS